MFLLQHLQDTSTLPSWTAEILVKLCFFFCCNCYCVFTICNSSNNISNFRCRNNCNSSTNSIRSIDESTGIGCIRQQWLLQKRQLLLLQQPWCSLWSEFFCRNWSCWCWSTLFLLAAFFSFDHCMRVWFCNKTSSNKGILVSFKILKFFRCGPEGFFCLRIIIVRLSRVRFELLPGAFRWKLFSRCFKITWFLPSRLFCFSIVVISTSIGWFMVSPVDFEPDDVLSAIYVFLSPGSKAGRLQGSVRYYYVSIIPGIYPIGDLPIEGIIYGIIPSVTEGIFTFWPLRCTLTGA